MTSLDGKNQFSMERLCLPKIGNSQPCNLSNVANAKITDRKTK